MSSHWTRSERYVVSSRDVVVIVKAAGLGERRPFFAFFGRLIKAILRRLWT